MAWPNYPVVMTPSNAAATDDDQAKGQAPSKTKVIVRVAGMLSAFVIVGALPFIVIGAFTSWEGGIKAAIYGYFASLIAGLTLDRRTALTLAVIVTCLVTVGALLSHSVLGLALIITASAALIPYFATKGKIRAAIFAAMMITNGVVPAIVPWRPDAGGTVSFYLAIAGIVFVGGLWGTFVGTTLKSKLPFKLGSPRTYASVRVALAGGIPLVIGTFLISYFVGSHYAQYRWVWILAPVFSMMLAKGSGPLSTSRDLIIGSVVGTGLAVVLLEIPLPTSIEMLAGMFVLCVGVAIPMTGIQYWVGASVSTAGVILLTGAGADPGLIAESRFLFGFFGAILALVLGVIVITCIRWATRSESTDNRYVNQDEGGDVVNAAAKSA